MEEDFVPNGSRSPIDELIQIYAYRHLTSEIIDMRKKCGCVAANKNYSQKPCNKKDKHTVTRRQMVDI